MQHSEQLISTTTQVEVVFLSAVLIGAYAGVSLAEWLGRKHELPRLLRVAVELSGTLLGATVAVLLFRTWRFWSLGLSLG